MSPGILIEKLIPLSNFKRIMDIEVRHLGLNCKAPLSARTSTNACSERGKRTAHRTSFRGLAVSAALLLLGERTDLEVFNSHASLNPSGGYRSL